MPIDAILFGGRRPNGVPLVYEAFDWKHGVFVGASMKSETTAAAEYKGKAIMHDPFAMRPFFGYNFGHYLQHWLSMETAAPGRKLPKVYHVNWFRKDDQVSVTRVNCLKLDTCYVPSMSLNGVTQCLSIKQFTVEPDV